MDVEPLKKLALIGAFNEPIKLSSPEFAVHLNTSPQTAARRLMELEKNEYITRKIVPSGQWVCITDRGINLLKCEYLDYQRIFSKNRAGKEIVGEVITGLGEGQYYIALDGYMEQFKQKLGFKPFPGTLNLKLKGNNIVLRAKMLENKGIKISGFAGENRTFGGGTCFKVMINGIAGAIIVPDRTHYPEDIIEIIAPVNLRENLGVSDGSVIRVSVEEY